MDRVSDSLARGRQHYAMEMETRAIGQLVPHPLLSSQVLQSDIIVHGLGLLAMYTGMWMNRSRAHA